MTYNHTTKGCPSIGAFPAVAPERIAICKPRADEHLPGPDWRIIRYKDGGRACMHVSQIVSA